MADRTIAIRPARPADDDGLWAILEPVIRAGETYPLPRDMTRAEALAYWHQVRLPVVLVRLFNTVGPRQTGRYGMVVPRFVRQALLNEPITVYGDGNQSRCFCHVKDAVWALTRLLASPSTRGQLYNVGNNEEVTINELADLVRTRVGDRLVEAAGGNTFGSGLQATQAAGEQPRPRITDRERDDVSDPFYQHATYAQLFWAPREWLVTSLIGERLSVEQPFKERVNAGAIDVTARLTSVATVGASVRLQRDVLKHEWGKSVVVQVALKTVY